MATVTVGGHAIDYSDTLGDGPPVVMVHAFPLNSSQWQPQVEALAGRVRVVTLDLLGFGASDAPDDPSAYSMTAFADEVRAVVDDAGVSEATVCGLSIGGYVCFELWRRHRDVVGAFVLADTRAEADTPEVLERRTRQQELVRAHGPEALAHQMIEGLLSENTRTHRPDVVARVLAAMDNPAAGYVGALEALKTRPDSIGALASIDVPTLVVVGEHDALTPRSAARTLHEHIGGSTLHVVPTAGHLSNLESPADFNGALAGLLGVA